MAHMRRFSKAIAAFIGGLTPPAIVGILAAFGVHMELEQAGVIIGGASAILALVATVAAPPNQPTESADGSVGDAGSTRP